MGRFEKGRSGNPHGRPLAARGLRAALVARYRDDAALLVERVEELSRLTGRNARVSLAATELLLSYHSGKPKQEVELAASVTVNERLAAERDLLRELSLPQLEELAAQSQALIDKAVSMAKANAAMRDLSPSRPRLLEGETINRTKVPPSPSDLQET